MERFQLTQHVLYTPCDSSRDRPVLGYILGDDRSVMVDAGNSEAHAGAFLEAMAGLPRPCRAYLTHWHWDHTFGVHALPWETVASVHGREEYRRMAGWVWSDGAMRQRLAAGEEIPFADEHIRAEYPDLTKIRVTEPSRYLTGDETLDCGGATCRAILAPSAHSEDSLLVLVPEDGVLFIGDCCNDDFYRDRYRDLEKTRELYRLLESLPFRLALPGHSGPMEKEKLLAFLGQFL